jgi:hypothetical protein
MRLAVQFCPGGSRSESGFVAKHILARAFSISWKQRFGSTDWHLQMVDYLAGFGNNHFRHEMAMAVAMIAFEAQQAASPIPAPFGLPSIPYGR